MPSSESIHETQSMVSDWYYKTILLPKYGELAAKEICNRTSYNEMKEAYAKAFPNVWMGAYSSF